MKKNKKIKKYLSIINKIEKVRSKNTKRGWTQAQK